MFTAAGYWILSWARWIQPNSYRSIIFVPFHLCLLDPHSNSQAGTAPRITQMALIYVQDSQVQCTEHLAWVQTAVVLSAGGQGRGCRSGPRPLSTLIMYVSDEGTVLYININHLKPEALSENMTQCKWQSVPWHTDFSQRLSDMSRFYEALSV